jgi:hypothetical protein
MDDESRHPLDHIQKEKLVKRNLIVLALLSLLFALTFASVQAQAGGPIPGGPDPSSQCLDASGAPIACPQDGGTGGSSSGLPGDRDGDSLPDGSDRCPEAGGHADLAGCPDADGDNTPDVDDTCPTVGGPDTNGGCPVEEGATGDSTTPPATEAPADSTGLLPPLPADGRCVVATLRDAAVNVRATPGMDAVIVGSLLPGQTVAVAHIWIGTDGTWYRLIDPAGWVAGSVVRVGGDCSTIGMSDFGDPATAAGAVPHWGPNGELTFCLPDYAMGEDTCVPTSTAGAVPNWGPNGELTFCLPDYAIGEDTCVVIPSSAKPHWNTIDDLVYCIKDDLGEDDCFVLDTDAKDGGFVIGAALDENGTPPENPVYHKYLLVGDDGLLVLTAPIPDGSTERPNGSDFPLYFAACTDETNPDCDYAVMMVDVDLPLAACYYDPVTNPEVEACDTDNLAGKVQFQDFHFMVAFVPFNPDLPLAACYYDPVTNPEVEACDTDNLMREVLPPDLPIAACFYDSVTNPNPEACDTDGLGNQYQPEDLPIAACAFDPDALIQCDNGELPDGSTAGIVLENVIVSSIANPSEPTAQTREHILLARQVQVPALMEEGFQGGIRVATGDLDGDGVALLLPAVQKVREAAAR